jgi:hypothetical protein
VSEEPVTDLFLYCACGAIWEMENVPERLVPGLRQIFERAHDWKNCAPCDKEAAQRAIDARQRAAADAMRRFLS